ncbi:hypothetical protein RsTz2092_11610 [Deferribacterales bacterium RsTz2092]|nr:hypothetical protein AGMMS49941_07660 [Deferribacterales bacterium]
MSVDLKSAVLELIRRSSTSLHPSWERAIADAAGKEDKDSSAGTVFSTILENIKLARDKSAPICQDTGSLTFYVDYPAGGRESNYTNAIIDAVIDATGKQYLRPNAVDSITGKNTEDNTGVNAPVFYYHQWDKNEVRIRFMQKGGGSENCGAQYRIPDSRIGAGRDLKGVRKVVIDAAQQAQGQGCAPGIFGVAIGGDRASCAKFAKEQLFRKYGERSSDPELAKLEKQLLDDINSLGIGPMGFGGKTSALEVFIASQHRHPATYYVSIAYLCWANRNGTLTINGDKVTYD